MLYKKENEIGRFLYFFENLTVEDVDNVVQQPAGAYLVLQTTGKRACLWSLCAEVKISRQGHNVYHNMLQFTF